MILQTPERPSTECLRPGSVILSCSVIQKSKPSWYAEKFTAVSSEGVSRSQGHDSGSEQNPSVRIDINNAVQFCTGTAAATAEFAEREAGCFDRILKIGYIILETMLTYVFNKPFCDSKTDRAIIRHESFASFRQLWKKQVNSSFL